VAEDMPRRNEDSGGAPDPTADLPEHETSPIDMTEFEAMLATGEGVALDERVGPVPGLPHQPTVEWAIAWADGHLTRVDDEAAARLVTARCPACGVAYRIVGDWGLA
jgi:hypothetical protein